MFKPIISIFQLYLNRISIVFQLHGSPFTDQRVETIHGFTISVLQTVDADGNSEQEQKNHPFIERQGMGAVPPDVKDDQDEDK